VRANDIQHIKSAPYHPSTNGLAERFVQSFKMAMKSSKRDTGSTQKQLSKFLLAYRSTPHATTGETPAMLLFGRNLQTKLDLIKPNIRRNVEKQQSKMVDSRHTKTTQFHQGQRVIVRDYRSNQLKWTSGTISQQNGPVSYRVHIGGSQWKRSKNRLEH